jgi:hypothetical protein
MRRSTVLSLPFKLVFRGLANVKMRAKKKKERQRGRERERRREKKGLVLTIAM